MEEIDMRIFDLTMKDLTQIFRDKRTLLFLVAMPIVFTLFMGFAYKSGSKSSTPEDSRIPLGWVNNDPNMPLAEQLYASLSKLDSIRLVELAPEAAANSVRKGETAGVLIVPAGFSLQVEAGSDPQLTLLADLNSPNGQSLYNLLRDPITQLWSAIEIGRLGAESTGIPQEYKPSFSDAMQAWSQVDNNKLIQVETAVAQTEKSRYDDNPYNQASPGILVMFAIFGLVVSGQTLVTERKLGTLQRMMTTTMRSWQMVAGHMLAMFAVVFLQEVVLVIFGQLALGVNYFREPLGTLLVSLALGLWIAATGLLIGVLARNDSQVVLFSLIGMFVFSSLGGLWFPLEASSGAFGAIGRLMPSAWAMTGYQNLLIRGLDFISTLAPTLALLAYSLGFFAIAVWRFRKS
jgi:ABC-2 type transport system permease protein